jgi:hypothetical protein
MGKVQTIQTRDGRYKKRPLYAVVLRLYRCSFATSFRMTLRYRRVRSGQRRRPMLDPRRRFDSPTTFRTATSLRAKATVRLLISQL